MVRTAIACIMLSLLLLAYPLDAKATGYGFYAGFGGGSAEWSRYFGSSDTRHYNFGLALDTAPSRNDLFNYHLNVGYDAFSIKAKEAGGAARFKGVVISNNFGFGGLISPDNRLWIGPEVRIVTSSGDRHLSESAPNTHASSFGLGFGTIIGFNHNYGDNSTFVFKIGYVSTVYSADGGILYYRDHFDEKLVFITMEYLIRTSGDRK